MADKLADTAPCIGCFWLADRVDPENGLPWCAHRIYHGHIQNNERRCVDGFITEDQINERLKAP